MTLSLEDLPALTTEVRLRVLAGALDPDAPRASLDLVPTDEPGTEPDEPVGSLAAAADDDPTGYDDLGAFGDDVPAESDPFGSHDFGAPGFGPHDTDLHHREPSDDTW